MLTINMQKIEMLLTAWNRDSYILSTGARVKNSLPKAASADNGRFSSSTNVHPSIDLTTGKLVSAEITCGRLDLLDSEVE